MPSVIIPAHNEEAIIERVISAVLAEEIENLECVVVPNACSDRTAERARRFEPAVRVIETDTPGKCNALNLGEGTSPDFLACSSTETSCSTREHLKNSSRPAVRKDRSFRRCRSSS